MRYSFVAVALIEALLAFGCASQTAVPNQEPRTSVTQDKAAPACRALPPAPAIAKPGVDLAGTGPPAVAPGNLHHTSVQVLPGNAMATEHPLGQLTAPTQEPAAIQNPPATVTNAKSAAQGTESRLAVVELPEQQFIWGTAQTIIAALCLVLFAVVLVVVLRYQRSSSTRARKRLREIVGRFEDVLSGQKRISQESQDAIAAAAQEYIKEMRRAYLQSISLDEVRN